MDFSTIIANFDPVVLLNELNEIINKIQTYYGNCTNL